MRNDPESDSQLFLQAQINFSSPEPRPVQKQHSFFQGINGYQAIETRPQPLRAGIAYFLWNHSKWGHDGPLVDFLGVSFLKQEMSFLFHLLKTIVIIIMMKDHRRYNSDAILL